MCQRQLVLLHYLVELDAGPTLTVPPGDDVLEIQLSNYLPVPVSIVIPALPAALTPEWTDGTTGARVNLQQRAVSMQASAPAAVGGVAGQATYRWTGVRPAVREAVQHAVVAREIAFRTRPMGVGLQTVKLAGCDPQPESVRDDARVINEAATEFATSYEELIRLGRRRLTLT